MFKDVISLVSTTATTNAMGDPVKALGIRAGIFADMKSVRQSEFYQAASAGLRAEIMFVVRSIEYLGEESLIYGSKTYNIIRTYVSKNGENIELICQGTVS